ncbi:MAG TPA: C1 family peptidase [Tenuifilaceae bacterium]|nr:C1 family peptidase [Tenuifilaceae bacterium]
MMKKNLIVLLACGIFLFSGNIFAQDTLKGYQFTPLKDIKTTSVKNQYRSGTCWSFSGTAFLESELLRMGKPEVNLSPMFIVRTAYADKSIRYVRFHGTDNFGSGGIFYDVLEMIKEHGIVPLDVYSGLNYGEDKPVLGELDAVALAFVKAIVENPNRKLTPVWPAAFNGILDAYLGKVPEKFEYNGKEYTPKSYFESLGLNLDDYVIITSFTHHPYYQKFVLEIPDNWENSEVYNVPLNDFEEIIDNAVDNGYPVAWASDVSERGFSWKNGVAIVPDVNYEETEGSDKEHWTQLSQKEKENILYSFEKPVKEVVVTPEMRQQGFDNYQTTDDHGILICGKAKDQNGDIFYKVKNSWGTDAKYDGYFYASKPYVLLKTISIMVHKDAVPKKIAKQLGIK